MRTMKTMMMRSPMTRACLAAGVAVASGCGNHAADKPPPAAGTAVTAADDAGGAAPAPVAPAISTLNLSGLEAPFDRGFSAIVTFSEDTLLVFRGTESAMYAPLDATMLPARTIDRRVDAALRWSDDSILLASGDQAHLVELGTAAPLATLPLATLGVPETWTYLDAAAIYDDERWIFFHEGEFAVVRMPHDDQAAALVGVYPLAELGLTEWADGIDAATNLLDGRLALFRGDGYMLLDMAAGTVTAPRAFADSAPATL